MVTSVRLADQMREIDAEMDTNAERTRYWRMVHRMLPAWNETARSYATRRLNGYTNALNELRAHRTMVAHVMDTDAEALRVEVRAEEFRLSGMFAMHMEKAACDRQAAHIRRLKALLEEKLAEAAG